MSHRSPEAAGPPAVTNASSGHSSADPSASPSATPPVPSPTQSSGRSTGGDLAWVSWLRVLAILGVVLIHVGGVTGEVPGARLTPQGQLGVALDFCARWCVPVFVMLSGTLLLDPARYRGAEDFWRKRALRLVPAVIVWHLVYLVYVEVHTDWTVTPKELVQRILTGQLYTALYFFWIVLGLAVVTPLLLPWIAASSRRAVLIAALIGCAVPALTVVTVPLRTDALWSIDVSWVETPWTWWIPYLGVYLLGYALREVILTRWRLVLVAAFVVAGSALLTWQWGRTSGLGGTLERYLPAEAYYGPVVLAISAAVFLVGHALIRPGGLLGVLARRGPAFTGRRLGDATLGVFAVHLLVRQGLLHLPLVGGAVAASSVAQLLVRCVLVFTIAYVIALVARRIPYLRRIV